MVINIRNNTKKLKIAAGCCLFLLVANFINGRYFLGVRPTDVAYKSFSVTPELNDYGCIEGVVPTVNGEISIGMNTRVLKVKSSVDGKGVIYIHKKYNPEIRGELRGDFYSVPINKGEEICVKLNYARNI